MFAARVNSCPFKASGFSANCEARLNLLILSARLKSPHGRRPVRGDPDQPCPCYKAIFATSSRTAGSLHRICVSWIVMSTPPLFPNPPHLPQSKLNKKSIAACRLIPANRYSCLRAVSIHVLTSEDRAGRHFFPPRRRGPVCGDPGSENATWHRGFSKEQNRNRCKAGFILRCLRHE